jgi:hypothetical protein
MLSFQLLMASLLLLASLPTLASLYLVSLRTALCNETYIGHRSVIFFCYRTIGLSNIGLTNSETIGLSATGSRPQSFRLSYIGLAKNYRLHTSAYFSSTLFSFVGMKNTNTKYPVPFCYSRRTEKLGLIIVTVSYIIDKLILQKKKGQFTIQLY